MEKFTLYLNKFSNSNFIQSIFFLLTFVNTLYLAYLHFTNRPNLKSKPISKYGNHMIWTIFPEYEDEQGRIIRTYAFIPYMKVYNIGKQPVELDTWELMIKDKLTGKKIYLDILPIPEAIQYLEDGSAIKYEMLGMNNNVGTVNPGCSMSGLSLYVIRYYVDKGNENDHGIIINEDCTVNGYFKIEDIYGNNNKQKVLFQYNEYEKVEEIMPNIHKSIYKRKSV